MLILRYAIATLIPLACLLLGAVLGGWWAALALVWLTLFAAGMDHLLSPPPVGTTHAASAEALSVTLASGHLALLPLASLAFADPTQTWGETITLALAAASFMGQVSHPNAHELIHRRPRALRRLGVAVYVSMLFGHHVSAHRLVHHAFVGTESDPTNPAPCPLTRSMSAGPRWRWCWPRSSAAGPAFSASPSSRSWRRCRSCSPTISSITA